MLLKDLITIIDSNYPPILAYDWDNPGLILGHSEKEIKKALVTLDVTQDVLNQAVSVGADCIFSHHPLLINGIKQITSATLQGKLLLRAAEEGIALFAAHTNMDTSPNGINRKLAEIFNLQNSVAIEKNDLLKNAGLGQIGNIETTTLRELCETTKILLKTPYVRYSGDLNQKIKRIAIGSGSCSELIPKSIQLGADVIITSDLKYHTCLDFANTSFSIIDAGHFPTEQIAMEMFAEILKNSGIHVVFSTQTDIFNIL